jgi:NitT/TauT family transport system substrate-binding protein
MIDNRVIRNFHRHWFLVISSWICLLEFSCSGTGHDSGIAPAGNDSITVTAGTRNQRKVRLMPYWVTSAQFAGYYVGIEKGIFRTHGIDLEVMPFDPFRETKTDIAGGNADFALLWLLNAIKIRSEGVNIVNIAQLSTRSSLMLLSKKSSGIRQLSDLNGKRAAIWSGFELQPRALFAKYNLDVRMIPIGSTNTLFLLDGVEAINANWFDEYHSILNNGYDSSDLVPFFFADYGLNFLEDGIYCLSEKARKDPGLCYDFVTATLESWRYAYDHPEETLDIVIRIAKNENRPVNRSHQQWMLDRYRELYLSKDKKTFNTMLAPGDYQTINGILVNSNLIDHVVPYEEFFVHYAGMKPSGSQNPKPSGK